MSPVLLALLAVVVALAVVYGLVNGMRDAPNAIALPVRSRALTPAAALVLAAVMNLLGGVLSGGFLSVVWEALPQTDPDDGTVVLMVAVGMAVSIGWGLIAWARRMPVSMTHALIAGLLGAGVALHVTGDLRFSGGWSWDLIVIAIVGLTLTPVLAWFLSWLLVTPAAWIGRDAAPGAVNHNARMTLAITCAANALGHGVQAGQRVSLMVVLAFAATGTPQSTMWWLPALTGVTLGIGTLFGGWRIAHTLTETIVRLDPLRSAVASLVSAVLLFAGSYVLNIPLSSTHSAVGAIVGAGQNQQYTAVRWQQVYRIVRYWVATLILCGVVALILAAAGSPLF